VDPRKDLTMTTQRVERAPSTWSPDYWLRHCEGFRVVAPGGRLGFVEVVLHDEDGNPTELGVAGGLFGTRLAFVRVANIAAIDARAERITLRPGACVRA
jgi:hypothetical protein